jgi:hypothetical protein
MVNGADDVFVEPSSPTFAKALHDFANEHTLGKLVITMS